MINPDLPVEFEDGTPLQIVKVDGERVYVSIPKGVSIYRNGRQSLQYTYYYSIHTGVFGGDHSGVHKVLRNVDVKEYEEDLV